MVKKFQNFFATWSKTRESTDVVKFDFYWPQFYRNEKIISQFFCLRDKVHCPLFLTFENLQNIKFNKKNEKKIRDTIK